jgi:hypothetical protein
MRRSVILFLAGLASVSAAPASANEIIIANIMPTSTTWMIGTLSIGPVPQGGHTIVDLLEGRRPVHVEDGAGGSADANLLFDPAEQARYGDRRFWCIFSRAAKDGKPAIIQLSKDLCQQFIDNQPPGPRKS